MNIIQVSFILVVFVSVILQEVKGNQGRNFVQTLKRRVRSTCFCTQTECCSKWGYCGNTDPYCGEGCQSGPCKTSLHTTLDDSFDITRDTFACIFPKIDTNLRARRFKGLTEAMEQMKWKATNNIEAAIFLSHVSHETDGLKTLVEYCSRQGSKSSRRFSSFLDLPFLLQLVIIISRLGVQFKLFLI
jgi:DNA gyrase/topoisomerase IV subunit B